VFGEHLHHIRGVYGKRRWGRRKFGRICLTEKGSVDPQIGEYGDHDVGGQPHEHLLQKLRECSRSQFFGQTPRIFRKFTTFTLNARHFRTLHNSRGAWRSGIWANFAYFH
jgi:hypothetical protein